MKTLLAPLALAAALFGTGCMTMYDSLADVPGAAASPYFERAQELRPGMTYEEVRALLGEPSESRNFSDIWRPVEGEDYTQLKVLYSGSKAVRATWISLASKAECVIF